MRYLDVCSGYSAATLGWQDLGWEAAGYAEIDPFASGILGQRQGATRPMRMPDPEEPGLDAKTIKDRLTAIKVLDHYHWGDSVPNFGNFTTIGREDVGSVQLLVGGTPCQSFSQAGKRLGLDDPRGNLTLEFLALAKRIQPKWMVWENVPGFLSHEDGRTAGTFFWLLGQLGYGWAFRVLDSQYVRVDGHSRAVPQRRRRVFVVGCLGNPAAAAAVLFDRESLRGDPKPRRRAGEEVAGSLSASAGRRGGVDEGERGKLIPARMVAFGEYAMDDTASTIKQRDYKDATDLVMDPVAKPLTSSRQSTDDGARTYIPIDTTQITNPNNRSNPQPGDPCHSLAAGAHPPAIAFPSLMSGTQAVRMDTEDVSITLTRKNPTAVAFKSSHYTRGKDGAPADVAPPLTADTDKGDQDTLLLAFSCKDHGQDVGEVSPTLRAMPHEGSHANGGGQVAVVYPISEATARQRLNQAATRTGMGIGDADDPMFTLQASQQHGVAITTEEPFCFQTRIARNGRGAPDDVAPALNGVNAGDTSDMRPVAALPTADGWAVRRLTPVECERLQGVPDHYTHIELKKRQRTDIDDDLKAYWLSHRPELTDEQLKHLCADSPRYRVLGNSFSRNVIRWIGRGIDDVERILREQGQ